MYPLFAIQKSMYLFERLYPNTSIYHAPLVTEIKGKIDDKALTLAFQQLIERHAILKSRLIVENGEPYFTLLDQANLPFKILNIGTDVLPPAERINDTLATYQQSHLLTQTFTFNQGPLWRGLLLKTSQERHQLVIVFHHLIIDLASTNYFLSDLSEFYNANLERRIAKPPKVENIFAIHPKVIPESAYQAKLNYWREQLINVNPVQLLPDKGMEKTFNFIGDRLSFILDKEIVDQCIELAKSLHSSFTYIVLSNLFLLLQNYTGESDLCIGLISANRRDYTESTENAINCFINSLPLRIIIPEHASFAAILKQVETTLKQGLENSLPLDDIIKQCLSKESKAKLERSVPFNIICNINNRGKIPLHFTGTHASEQIEINLKHSKFENFGFNFDKRADGSYEIFIEFNTGRFNLTTMQTLQQHFVTLLKNAIREINQPAETISMVSPAELLQLQAFHASTENIYTPAYTFMDILDDVVSKNPQRTAIVFHDEHGQSQSISYTELNLITDLLAAYLKNLGVAPERTVGVCQTRSIHLIIDILAILKAGGVVVTLEINPVNIEHKLSDTLIDIVLVDEHTHALFQPCPTHLFCINTTTLNLKQLKRELGLEYSPPAIKPQHLAYIMYTSGTTGTPKGVMIEHHSLTNLAFAVQDRKLPHLGKILATAPPTFDAFFWELLEWLATNGGELHLINDKERLSTRVQERVIQQNGIHCVTLLPEFIKNLSPEDLPSLIDIVSMGATPSKEVAEKWSRLGRIFRNEYGPTEGTIASTTNPYDCSVPHTSIGRPMRNMGILLLNKHLKECPLYQQGEIYIFGAGLARGYVANSELTEHAFPLLRYNEKNTRFYATGDYARYILNADNQIQIEFIGRKDRQIKLHGVRIEIDGIQALLQQHPLISEIYLTPNENQTALSAYIVPKPDQTLLLNNLQEFLRQTTVPRVAWPKHIVLLDQLPLLRNGKVDVHALPQPMETTTSTDLASLPPLQQQIAQIWLEILDIHSIDINKTFTELGGDSIKLPALEFALSKKFHLANPLSLSLFNMDMTIASLAQLLTPSLNPPMETSSQLSSTLGPLSLFGSSRSVPVLTIEDGAEQRNILASPHR
jgi:amino acid adenylation domain-containing protein